MPTNELLPFAEGGSANVEPQATYATDTQRTNGQQPGIARSAINNKAIRQANFMASNMAQFICNTTGADVLDNTVDAQLLAQLSATLLRIPVDVFHYTAGSFNFQTPYKFFVASASATSGATYTNNTFTFTVTNTISGGTYLQTTGTGDPTASGTLTKASGTGDATITIYAFRKPLQAKIKLIGSAGAGAGSTSFATMNATSGADGSAATFGGFITAPGGTGGPANTAGVSGMGGVFPTINSPAEAMLPSSEGTAGGESVETISNTAEAGGEGGSSTLQGRGQAGSGSPGADAKSNTGSGGGGGGAGGSVNTVTGAGGGSGSTAAALLVNPTGIYPIFIPGPSTGGSAGTSGFNGGAGAGGQGEVLCEY